MGSGSSLLVSDTDEYRLRGSPRQQREGMFPYK